MAAATAIAVVGMAVSAYGASQSAAAGRAGAAANREMAINSAREAGMQAGAKLVQQENILKEGQDRADKILAEAKRLRSSQKVAAAAAGFMVDSGTAEAFMSQTDKLAQADALATLYQAGDYAAALRSSAEAEITTGISRAEGFLQQAQAAYQRGQAGMISNLGQGAQHGVNLYYALNPPTTTTPSPSPAPAPTTTIGPTPTGP